MVNEKSRLKISSRPHVISWHLKISLRIIGSCIYKYVPRTRIFAQQSIRVTDFNVKSEIQGYYRVA